MKTKLLFRKPLLVTAFPRLLFAFLIIFLCSAIESYVLGTPLNGNFTINSGIATGGTNFQSFNAFASSINTNGISGNVTVTVVTGSGPYNEQVIFNNIQGASSASTVTLEGSGEIITAVTSSTNRHVVRLTNIQYFTINNLRVLWNPASSGGFFGIHIFNTGNHITISNCQVNLSGTTSTLYGAYVASGSETSILTTGDFHNITFTGNLATGGGYGASVFGLVSNLASNIIISNNVFNDFHSNGIYLRETNGAVISHNHLDKSNTSVSSANAIQIAQNANINAKIFNNFIKVSQVLNGTVTFRGIYLFNGIGHKVYNNVIYNVKLQSGNFTGIEVRTGATAPEIYFNTISIDDSSTTSGDLYGIKEELSNTNTILRNNLISISQPTTGTKSGLVLGATSAITTALNSNYNIIRVPNGNMAQKGTLTPTYYPSLASWQTASGQDANSLSLDPLFVSLALPQPTNTAANNAGIPISWITTDVLGAPREPIPDIGAYEFGAGPPNPPAAILGDTVVCAYAAGVVYTIQPVTGATSYNWTVPTGSFIVSGQGTTTITVAFGSSSGSISVAAVNASGSSSATALGITVNALPVVTLTLPFDTIWFTSPAITLSGGLPPNGTYSGPGVFNGMFNPSAAGIGSHTILYTYLDTNGCSDTATDVIVVEMQVGIDDELSDNQEIKIYPNPFTTTARIIHNLNGKEVVVYLFDYTGKQVRKYIITGRQFTISRDGLYTGIYLLVVSADNKMTVRKKLIVR